MSDQSAPRPVPKRPRSRLRIVDAIGESWTEISRHIARTLLTAIGVALGVAAIVATSTIVLTIRFQVSDDFDARRATQIDVRAASGDGGTNLSPFPVSSVSRARSESLSGVTGVAEMRSTGRELPVALSNVAAEAGVPQVSEVMAIDLVGMQALGVAVEGPGWDLWHEDHNERVAVMSHRTAEHLGLSGLAVGDFFFVDGNRFTHMGTVLDSARAPGLMDTVVIPLAASSTLEFDTDRDRLVVVVEPGAAQAVSQALPVALDPALPDVWIAYAPVNDETTRQSVDVRLQSLAVGLGGVILVLGIVSIANATLTSVLQRMNEIGLRRAIGARPRHVATHILLDSVGIGLVGGVVGSVIGVTAMLMLALAKGWVPVVDPLVVVLAPIGGAAAGFLAGIYPAYVGSRIEPTEALRR